MLRIKSNGDVVLRDLDAAARVLRDPAELLEDLGEHMVNTSIPQTFRAGGRPSPWPKSKWQNEAAMQGTGALQRSVRHEVRGRKLRVGSNLRYARQRQLGGEIRPVKARALAIPLPGMPNSMRRPRRWGDRLFYMESTKGDANTVGILASKDRQGSVTPRFVLRSKVTQPARPFVQFLDEDLVYLQGALARHLQEAVGG